MLIVTLVYKSVFTLNHVDHPTTVDKVTRYKVLEIHTSQRTSLVLRFHKKCLYQNDP